MQPTGTGIDDASLAPLPSPAMFAIGVIVGLLGVLALTFLVLMARDTSEQSDPVVALAPAEGATGEVDGAAVAQSAGCLACHSTDGTDRVGPTWLQLVGSSGPGGSTIDTDYLREAIVDPNAQIAAGFQAGLMPQNYESILSAPEIDALVTYIAGLG